MLTVIMIESLPIVALNNKFHSMVQLFYLLTGEVLKGEAVIHLLYGTYDIEILIQSASMKGIVRFPSCLRFYILLLRLFLFPSCSMLSSPI